MSGLIKKSPQTAFPKQQDNYAVKQDSGTTCPYYFKQLFAAVSIILVAIISRYLPLKTDSLQEWIPFFLIGLTIPVIFYTYQQACRAVWGHLPTQLNARLYCGIGISMLLFVIAKANSTLWHTIPREAMFWSIGFTSCTTLIISKTLYNTQGLTLGRQDRFPILLSSGVIALTAWCALFQLPNWVAYCERLTHHEFDTIIASIICFGFAKYYVFEPEQDNLRTASYSRMSNLSLYVLAIILFFILGFRSDSLFSIEGSAFHWAYFVGPTATIRSHGWLLWDTPSQYGFLNILIASILPTKSAWQAIYLLEGALLVMVAMIMFHIANHIKSIARASLSLLIVISALHFADPVLEGPAPFPSSSVMRFFWCYIFIFLLYQYWKSERFSFKAFVSYGSISWVIAVLWSAESAIYCSCIFFPALLIGCVQQILSHNKDTHPFKYKTFFYFSIPIGLLIAASIGISIYYKIILGYYPEWSNIFLYGFLYAGGFGSYPLNPTGSVWMLILLLIGTISLTATVIQENVLSRSLVLLLGLVGCLWGTSSYFVGRAVPNNITAILPLLTLILLIILQLNRSKLAQQPVLIIQAIAVPFLFIVMITLPGNPALRPMIRQLSTFSAHIEQQIPVATNGPELLTLMQKANIQASDLIIYSGYAALPPRPNSSTRFSEQPWLPSPLQLLEQPIPIEHQELTIRRFIKRLKPNQGYLVHAKGEAEDRYLMWGTLLEKYFRQTAIFEGQHWIILRFNLKINDPSL